MLVKTSFQPCALMRFGMHVTRGSWIWIQRGHIRGGRTDFSPAARVCGPYQSVVLFKFWESRRLGFHYLHFFFHFLSLRYLFHSHSRRQAIPLARVPSFTSPLLPVEGYRRGCGLEVEEVQRMRRCRIGRRRRSGWGTGEGKEEEWAEGMTEEAEMYERFASWSSKLWIWRGGASWGDSRAEEAEATATTHTPRIHSEWSGLRESKYLVRI